MRKVFPSHDIMWFCLQGKLASFVWSIPMAGASNVPYLFSPFLWHERLYEHEMWGAANQSTVNFLQILALGMECPLWVQSLIYFCLNFTALFWFMSCYIGSCYNGTWLYVVLQFGLLDCSQPKFSWNPAVCSMAGLILGLHPANERRHYKVTLPLIGWVQT